MVTVPHVLYHKHKLRISYNSLHDYSHLSNRCADPHNHCIKTVLYFIRNQENKEHLASSERPEFTLGIMFSYIHLKSFGNSALREGKVQQRSSSKRDFKDVFVRFTLVLNLPGLKCTSINSRNI